LARSAAAHRSLPRWKLQLTIGVAISVVVAAGVISYRALIVSTESRQEVRHTHEVLEKLEDVRLSVAKIEADYRAFALTGEESYLQSYRAGVLRVAEGEAAVRGLTTDNPTQQRMLPLLEDVTEREIRLASMVNDRRRAGGLAAAVEAMATVPAQPTIDELQTVVHGLEQEELRLLALRNAVAKRRVTEVEFFLVLRIFLGLLIVIAAGWSVYRESARREKAEAALQDSEDRYRARATGGDGASSESGAKSRLPLEDAERQLARMEGRYRGLLDAAPDAMVVLNSDGQIVLLNVQTEKQFGYPRDELLSQKVTAIIPNGFAERLVADGLRSADEALAQQIGTGIELTGRRKNGSVFPIEIMLSPLESPDGILVTAAIRDITARIAAEADLLQKVDELNRSNEELAQFAYIASHDLQEPLRMVASYTQLLSRQYKGKLDADADEFIAYAVDGASRMQRLIQDLLLYSRVGTKGRDLFETSSEATLQHALLNLRGAIEESGALVTHDPLPNVLADELQLTQLFQNLIGNAIKYQNPGIPRVHVSAHKDGSEKWMFSVRDNGFGIDSQYFERIFGMFQRLHKREEFDGTGIGLAICKKIVERHGGGISVESEVGRGSTFTFGLAASGVTS
jgi:PAS domain S-box-containing protein